MGRHFLENSRKSSYHCTQAWNLASPVAEPYLKFAERWGSLEFSKSL